MQFHIGAGQLCRQCATRHIAIGKRHAGISYYSKVRRVNQPVTGFAYVSQGGDAYLVSNLHPAGRGFNETTVSTIRSRRIQGTAHFGGARGHVAHQHDATALVGNGLRLYRTAVSHHAAHQHTGTSGGHHHQTTVGFDQVFVLYQGIHHAFINFQGGQTLSAEDQGGFVAGGHGDGAFAGDDDALVAYLRGEQGDVAAKGCLQRAKVYDAARLAVTLEAAFAGHEVGVADAVGGDK